MDVLFGAARAVWRAALHYAAVAQG